MSDDLNKCSCGHEFIEGECPKFLDMHRGKGGESEHDESVSPLKLRPDWSEVLINTRRIEPAPLAQDVEEAICYVTNFIKTIAHTPTHCNKELATIRRALEAKSAVPDEVIKAVQFYLESIVHEGTSDAIDIKEAKSIRTWLDQNGGE